MVIILGVVIRNSLAKSQPDPPHDDPIHDQITFQKINFFIFVRCFRFFFSLEIGVETPLERCAVKNYAFWLLETLNFLSECQVMAKIRFYVKNNLF